MISEHNRNLFDTATVHRKLPRRGLFFGAQSPKKRRYLAARCPAKKLIMASEGEAGDTRERSSAGSDATGEIIGISHHQIYATNVLSIVSVAKRIGAATRFSPN
jgi:hypothetical protein